MKTRKTRLSEKTSFIVETTIKELMEKSALIGGIKNNDDYGFYDIKSVVLDIIEILENQAEDLKKAINIVESENGN